MKKLYVLAGVVCLAVAGVFGMAKIANAYSIRTGDNVTVPSGQTINDTVYAAGRTVDINSTVFGDVFCAGQNVTVSGTVHGDVICAGQTVTVSGKVDGDVRLAGQTVTLSAAVGGNATIGGQTFVLDSNGSVAGDLTTGGNDATLNGKIGRDIVLGGTNATVNNVVGRDIKVRASTLTLGAGARVGGNIAAATVKDISKDKQAVVAGTITRTAIKHENRSKHGAIFGFGVAWFVYWVVTMVVTAFVLALLFPRWFNATTNKGMPRPWKALLVGFLASMAVPVVAVLLLVSVVGIPLALILGLVWLVVLLLGGPVFSYYIGRLVLRGSDKPLLIMLVGAAILAVAYFIPVLGMLAWLAAMWFGTGMLLMQAFSHTPKPKYTIRQTAPAQPTDQS